MIYDWARYIQARSMAAVLAASSRRISGGGVYNDDGAPRVDDDEGINIHSTIDHQIAHDALQHQSKPQTRTCRQKDSIAPSLYSDVTYLRPKPG